MFDEGVLALRGVPKDWKQEAYPQSNRKFVHIYRSPKQAVLIRWFARTGTILDHPLFRPLAENLRIVPGQWLKDAPAIQSQPGQKNQVRPTPLGKEAQAEIQEAAARARRTLRLGRIRNPAKVAEAIYEAIEALRRRKGVKKDEKERFSMECGALWGEALCQSTGWKWRSLTDLDGQAAFAVCPSNGSHAVLPLQAVHRLVTHPKAANNSLLLFNMIASGKLPPSTKGAPITTLG